MYVNKITTNVHIFPYINMGRKKKKKVPVHNCSDDIYGLIPALSDWRLEFFWLIYV